MNYGRATTPARESLSRSTARRIWRSFVNPNARCWACQRPVFYYQSENGGRVLFDQLGPPWPKHPCMDRPTWRWPAGTGFILKEGDVTEPDKLPGWEREGWAPVVNCLRTAGRPTSETKDSLTGATVWYGADASELKVLWSFRDDFDWSGPVMMRSDPRSPYRVEFETLQLYGDALRPKRLVAVKNDVPTTVTTLLYRLREKR